MLAELREGVKNTARGEDKCLRDQAMVTEPTMSALTGGGET